MSTVSLICLWNFYKNHKKGNQSDLSFKTLSGKKSWIECGFFRIDNIAPIANIAPTDNIAPTELSELFPVTSVYQLSKSMKIATIL